MTRGDGRLWPKGEVPDHRAYVSSQVYSGRDVLAVSLSGSDSFRPSASNRTVEFWIPPLMHLDRA